MANSSSYYIEKATCLVVKLFLKNSQNTWEICDLLVIGKCFRSDFQKFPPSFVGIE